MMSDTSSTGPEVNYWIRRAASRGSQGLNQAGLVWNRGPNGLSMNWRVPKTPNHQVSSASMQARYFG